MMTSTVLLFCFQAFLVQNAYSSCIGAGLSGIDPRFGPLGFASDMSPIVNPASYSPVFSPVSSPVYSPVSSPVYSPASSPAYGGEGIGDISIAGRMPVAGTTVVKGQVPILGSVRFGGDVNAAGTVTITGSSGYRGYSGNRGYRGYC